MHTSTMVRMEWFVEHYVNKEGAKVLDVGSYDVNGSYKSLFNGKNIQYVGLDIEAGPNVDVVMHSPYSWDNINDEEFDYIISGQAFEHIEFPWLTIKEIYKKLKNGGVVCIIAPSSAPEHKYPFDCYRYYADGFTALAKWAGFTILDVSVSGIPARDVSTEWDYRDNDVCLIAMKGSVDLLETNITKFTYERRIDEAFDLRIRYDFMYQWINTVDKHEVLERFLMEHHSKTVYVYGFDYLGRLLCEELNKIQGTEAVVLEDEKKEVQFKDNSVLIISLLDSNRDLKLYLDTIWKDVSKFYLDDIFMLDKLHDFLEENKSVYIYGAGKIGRRMAKSLTQLGYGVEGFIVSDGKREQLSQDNYKISELREVKSDKDIAILVAVMDEFRKEIIDTLTEQEFSNFRSI